MDRTPQTVVVLGASADIGRELATRYLDRGCTVFGTYREEAGLGDLTSRPDFHAVRCDLADPSGLDDLARALDQAGREWGLLVSAAGTMEPVGPFFETDFDEWQTSLHVNALSQLRALHRLHDSRRRDGVAHVAFFAGGGTNGPMTNYSAYCASKILLIKMCELLDDEAPDLNIFIIGPGFVHTKIHEETLRAGERAGPGLEKTLRFLETQGTSFDDIYRHIEWCVGRGREVVGGRNFSTVHDPWRDGGEAFAGWLRGHADRHRLRRHDS